MEKDICFRSLFTNYKDNKKYPFVKHYFMPVFDLIHGMNPGAGRRESNYGRTEPYSAEDGESIPAPQPPSFSS